MLFPKDSSQIAGNAAGFGAPGIKSLRGKWEREMMAIKAFKWAALVIIFMAIIITGAVLSEVTIEVLHIFGIGSGTCGGNSPGYVFGCIIGYVVAKNGWV